MSAITILLAIVLQIVALWLIKHDHGLTDSKVKLIAGTLIFVASSVSFVVAFGVLAGIFIAFACISLLGMLYPLCVGSPKKADG